MKKIIITIAFFISFNAEAQSTPIPDSNFEIYLINLGIDHGIVNGSILNSDAEAVLSLNIALPTILDLTGLEAFKNLKTLGVFNYYGVTCPVYTMDSLKFLYIVGTTIPSLNISNNLMLDELTVEYTPITTLNLSTNVQLKKLNLKYISTIGILDITNNVALESVGLGYFSCDSIDFSQNINLKSLGINSLGLDTIDLSHNTALLTLGYNDSATSINITNNINLQYLNLEWNLFTDIDFSQNTAIEQLHVGNNNLDSLKVSNMPNLKQLKCDSNAIKKVDLRFNLLLESLDCRLNNLSELNIKNGNNSNVVNTSFNATNNPNLYCIEVDNVSYSYSNWTNKDSQSYFTTYCNYDLSVPIQNENNILIFPNPINSQFKIKSPEQLIGIVITDLAGKKVFDSPHQNTYNIQHLSTGLYIITIQFSDKEINKKIQINK